MLADGEVGINCVRWLVENYRNDLCFIGATEENSIADIAKSSGVPFEKFVSSQQMYDAVEGSGLSPDLGLLLWWPKIIREPLISFPRNGFINTHPSLLPHNRGKHYSFWAIVENSPFGVTLHVVDEGVDTGGIVAQRSIVYDWTDTGETLAAKAREAMTFLFKELYPTLRLGQFPYKQQNLELGSFHKADDIVSAIEIDLNGSYVAKDLLNLLRAKTYRGLPGCWFKDGNKRYEITLSVKEIQ